MIMVVWCISEGIDIYSKRVQSLMKDSDLFPMIDGGAGTSVCHLCKGVTKFPLRSTDLLKPQGIVCRYYLCYWTVNKQWVDIYRKQTYNIIEIKCYKNLWHKNRFWLLPTGISLESIKHKTEKEEIIILNKYFKSIILYIKHIIYNLLIIPQNKGITKMNNSWHGLPCTH